VFSAAADVFGGDSWVHFGTINCDDYKSVCSQFAQYTVPNVFVFLNGTLVFRGGSATLDELVDIVNEKCGTFRKADGSFTEDVMVWNEESGQRLAEEREKYRKAGFDIDLIKRNSIMIQEMIHRNECSRRTRNRLFLKKVILEKILTEALVNRSESIDG
jgi:hypothetical protein